VIGIDEWASRKGWTFGTIVVDLRAREVVDVLSDRSSAATAAWLRRHPSVAIINRDRQGLYAEGARVGAPQACQVTGRLHLAQNFRAAVELDAHALKPPKIKSEGSASAAKKPDRYWCARVRTRGRRNPSDFRRTEQLCQEL